MQMYSHCLEARQSSTFNNTSPSLEGFFFVISLPPVIPTTVGIIQAAIIGVFVGMEVNLYLLNGAVVSQELRIE